MKISKKLENLYIRNFENERELNYPLGYRGIEIKFSNNVNFETEQEGEEYLICLEMYLNETEIDYYEYDGSRSIIGNLAEITFVVSQDDLDKFNKSYKEFKSNYETIMANYKNAIIAEEEIIPVIDVKQYIIAGNATITLEGKNNHFTYKIQKHSESKIWFVKLLTGCDNEVDYKYMGFFREDMKFKTSSKSGISTDSLGFKAFAYFMRRLENLPPELKIHYASKCPKCGRTLTTPESIQNGIGPECLKQLMEVS